MPWLGGAVLALCYGLAVVMVTGDWGKGAGIFCLVALVFVLLMLLLGQRIDAHPARFYVAGLILLISPFVSARGRDRTAWGELQARYAVTGPVAGQKLTSRPAVITRHLGEFMVRREPFIRVWTAFDHRGAYVAPHWPQSVLLRPLRIPAGELVTCRDSREHPGHTALLLRSAVEIAVGDPGGEVLGWCGAQQIPLGSEE